MQIASQLHEMDNKYHQTMRYSKVKTNRSGTEDAPHLTPLSLGLISLFAQCTIHLKQGTATGDDPPGLS